MSKPKPLEYKLRSWSIEYSQGEFFTGMGPGSVDWRATVTWKIDYERTQDDSPHIKVPDVVDMKAFATYNEAREFIEEQTGFKYKGFSDGCEGYK